MNSYKNLIWLGIGAFILYSVFNDKPGNKGLPPQISNSQYSSSAPAQPTPPAFNEQEQSLPYSGTISAGYTNGVAPFTIRTRNDGVHFYVKMTDASSSQVVGVYFIRSDESVNLQVPLGNYELKYATGKKWYGGNYLFGPDTSYSKADTQFNFYNDGNQISGYTVELFQQVNGNLHTTGIPPSQF
jgi:hypothetical protein